MISAQPQLLTRLIDLRIDLGNLSHPDLSLLVLHAEHFIERPMEVVTDVGYLLVEPVQGVAYDSPKSPPVSTSNA